jgi:hypothetical protein
MVSNSISGLSYAIFPDSTLDQSTQSLVNASTSDNIISGNTFYLFEGDMPPSHVLQTFLETSDFVAAYSANQIFKRENFDIKYSFDKNKKLRKIEKWPVDAETFVSAVTGIAKWGALVLTPKSIGVSEKLLIFTDAVGAWEDADQSVLISNTSVTAGENITLKSINITIQDSMLHPGELI